MHISIPTFTAAAILAALCIGAHADTAADPQFAKITGRSVVYFGDLNLNAEQDAKIMMQRIERAAKKACGGHRTFGSYTGRLDDTFDECRREAIARTVKQLGAPLVTRVRDFSTRSH